MENQQIKIVVLGHVDSGKSTTISHLIYNFGRLGKKPTMKFIETSGLIDATKMLETINGDCAILIVDCGPSKAKIDKLTYNINSVAVANINNVKQIIVACNKMDTTEPPFSEACFENLKAEISRGMKGYNPATVAYVPICGLTGDNILESSDKMPWFNGWAIERKDGNAC
ncbi:hypothetical protein ACQ4LE_005179 [Meloidogyne hapla]|uniref:Tr-type G domain-containing protein n=1 Tax=Meloidogyne hapla TaxID=6305 RepID=A0A1I8BCW6_MELHA